MAKPKLNAEAAYENAHLVAQVLVERVRELLFDMPAPGDVEHPINWCHVGDITRSTIDSRTSSIFSLATSQTARLDE
ncbi:MAG: hypothetical protein P1U77_27310 [Rubripirellula sp.]|nr:hypothetical protein [Rubripirellula sp.]